MAAYEVPFMEILLMEDVITSSGGSGNGPGNGSGKQFETPEVPLIPNG